MQDVWLRWQAADRTEVRNAAAFLSTTAARLAINVMQSARARHETLVGPWALEPVAPSGDPRVAVERCQAVACGVRLLLEKLTPTERAAYILREAFGYAYRDIAKVLRLAEANARQIVTRARQHLASGQTTATSAIEQERLLAAFTAAAQEGDVAGLERLFASDAFSTSGGSGPRCVTRQRAVADRSESSQYRAVSGQGFVEEGPREGGTGCRCFW